MDPNAIPIEQQHPTKRPLLPGESPEVGKTFLAAVASCHVRSGIRRASKPDKVYWKNHTIPLAEQVPAEDQAAADWLEYDPREHPECSAYSEMPA